VDPSSRWPTLAVLGTIVAGVPVYYLTVGRTAPGAVGREPSAAGARGTGPGDAP
jgi:hypothetical protein